MIIAGELATSAVRFFERVSSRMPASGVVPALTAVGLTPNQVSALASKFKPVEMPTPGEARIGLARMTRNSLRGTCGRRGLPDHVWKAMYSEYQTGKSCSEVAVIFGGTRQSVHDIFKCRGLQLRPQYLRLLKKIEYRGVAYTPGKNGYYRATVGDRKMLHHQMWEDAHGAIPDGWQVTFQNANHTDLRLDNMLCAPIADITRMHQRRIKANREIAA